MSLVVNRMRHHSTRSTRGRGRGATDKDNKGPPRNTLVSMREAKDEVQAAMWCEGKGTGGGGGGGGAGENQKQWHQEEGARVPKKNDGRRRTRGPKGTKSAHNG